jgi:CheY-like chemotaxis protein
LQEAAKFALHGTAIQCEFCLAEDLWPVEADEGQLSQVIHNLALNSAQAMPSGGKISIGAENVIDGNKKFVKITVSDSGCGIPEQDLQRIFDPYFTTKQQGNGLGLATCFSITRKHGGEIKAKSEVGVGSSFEIYIPAAEKKSRIAQHAPETTHGSARVLVMDDEEQIRKVTTAILEKLGYSVESAENGAQAIELFRSRKEEGISFDIVILDLTIPGGMGGKEVLAILKQIDANVKSIVSSGYSNDPVMANYQNYGFCAVLVKPYRLQEISGVLQELSKVLVTH